MIDLSAPSEQVGIQHAHGTSRVGHHLNIAAVISWTPTGRDAFIVNYESMTPTKNFGTSMTSGVDAP